MPPSFVCAWECRTCDVQGRTPPGEHPSCWNCEGPVTVVARPFVRTPS